jgi:hypothetical protein
MNLSKEAVFNAADTIADTGMEPTQREIIDRCGGSFSTVGPLMREWREARAAKARTRPVLPDTILDRLRTFGDELWSTTIDVTMRSVADERHRLDRERAALEEDRKASLGLLAAMETTMREQATQLDETRQTITSANAALGELKSRLAAATERAAVAEARAQEIEMRAHGLAQELAHLGRQNAELVRVIGRISQAGKRTAARAASRH